MWHSGTPPCRSRVPACSWLPRVHAREEAGAQPHRIIFRILSRDLSDGPYFSEGGSGPRVRPATEPCSSALSSAAQVAGRGLPHAAPRPRQLSPSQGLWRVVGASFTGRHSCGFQRGLEGGGSRA